MISKLTLSHATSTAILTDDVARITLFMGRYTRVTLSGVFGVEGPRERSE